MSKPIRIASLHVSAADARRLQARTASDPALALGDVQRAFLARLRNAYTAAQQARAAATQPAAWVHADGRMTGLQEAIRLVEEIGP